jgi:hypothetical protein
MYQLERARDEGIDILVYGKGAYIKLVEKLVFNLCELYFPGHVLTLTAEPTVRVHFHGGGSLLVVDCSHDEERGLQYLDSDLGFANIVIAEDERGDMMDEMKTVVIPLMGQYKHGAALIVLVEHGD